MMTIITTVVIIIRRQITPLVVTSGPCVENPRSLFSLSLGDRSFENSGAYRVHLNFFPSIVR